MKTSPDGDIALKIKKLRVQLSDVIKPDGIFNSDFYLQRWLISRQNNVDRTEMAIRESMVWRKENKIDTLADKKWDPEVLKDVPIYLDHYTKAGQPVVKINCDKIDLRALLKKYGKDFSFLFVNEMYAKFERLMIDHHNFHNHTMRRIPSIRITDTDATSPHDNSENIDNSNDNENYVPPSASPLIIIATFKDFSLWNAKSLDVIHLFLEGSKTGIKYFPCMATNIYMLDNNWISAMLFKMVKPVISTMPFSIECYDCDKTKWAPELIEILQQYPPSHEFYNKAR